ncbi:protein of unknown function [Pararobbsia alpina]
MRWGPGPASFGFVRAGPGLAPNFDFTWRRLSRAEVSAGTAGA